MASLGSANIGGEGFTIDLTDIKEVVVSKDRKTVSIGGGAIWTDVYDIISPQCEYLLRSCRCNADRPRVGTSRSREVGLQELVSAVS